MLNMLKICPFVYECIYVYKSMYAHVKLNLAYGPSYIHAKMYVFMYVCVKVCACI